MIRRIAKTRISFELLEDFIKGNAKPFKTNAPKDLKVVGIDKACYQDGCLVIYLESAMHRKLLEGEAIPEVYYDFENIPASG